ncbi:septin-4 isoform 2-T2 [Rhinophrynus dorsalis]
MIRHFLRNDSEEAELAEIIRGIPVESGRWAQDEEEERLNKKYKQEEEESFCREHQKEVDERLCREHEEEEERLRREHEEEKVRRKQYEEERLQREHQQEARLLREQEDEAERLRLEKQKHQREQQEERLRQEQQKERLHREQQEERFCRDKVKVLPAQLWPDNLANVVRHIKDDIEEEDSNHVLPIRPPRRGCPPLVPPLSPSRPKSPWGKFDPYDSSEEDKEYVGFATLPNQVHRKYVKKGFEFTLMVAGESGLGKSTLINSLFLTDLYRGRQLPSPEECVTQTVEIVKQTVDIEEKGVRLRLTVIDTPGYGDAINNEECWKPVADYIDQQFEQYFRDESGLNRRNLQDTRVHCCLYFLSPLGHGMRPLDIEFLRALQDKVNIVPILGKADSLTPAELQKKKQKIRDELEHFGIRIYQFPECDSDQDDDFKRQDIELKNSIPFAVIGANTVVEVNGRRVRGRMYPWGVVELENEQHCDFVKLRTMLIRTHMQDLKDVTRETHYENYRARCIQSLTQRVVRERNRNKLTRQSGTDFPIPSVPPSPEHETQRLIREKDEELRRMQEVLQKMQKQIKDSQ